MTDNTNTLKDVLKEYNCDEFECWCADKPELIQALNLYIEEKERLARADELQRVLDNVSQSTLRFAVENRIRKLRAVEITDEDIKKGWPKV